MQGVPKLLMSEVVPAEGFEPDSDPKSDQQVTGSGNNSIPRGPQDTLQRSLELSLDIPLSDRCQPSAGFGHIRLTATYLPSRLRHRSPVVLDYLPRSTPRSRDGNEQIS